MPDWNVILHLLTLALLGVGSYLLATFRTGTEAVVKTSAEEGVKAAFRALDWANELARELQKSRGLERQELRFRSYGTLWKDLRPLAIYDRTTIDNETARDLLGKLTDWYFSECGGLLLTPQARDFYFALQDLLRVTSSLPAKWNADRSVDVEGGAGCTFRKVLKARFPQEAISHKETIEKAISDKKAIRIENGIDVLDYFQIIRAEDWRKQPIELGKTWRRKTIKQLGAIWSELTERERFAVLQQVGSKLRSALVNDLESREQ